jgi:hypothetical protein
MGADIRQKTFQHPTFSLLEDTAHPLWNTIISNANVTIFTTPYIKNWCGLVLVSVMALLELELRHRVSFWWWMDPRTFYTWVSRFLHPQSIFPIRMLSNTHREKPHTLTDARMRLIEPLTRSRPRKPSITCE